MIDKSGQKKNIMVMQPQVYVEWTFQGSCLQNEFCCDDCQPPSRRRHLKKKYGVVELILEWAFKTFSKIQDTLLNILSWCQITGRKKPEKMYNVIQLHCFRYIKVSNFICFKRREEEKWMCSLTIERSLLLEKNERIYFIGTKLHRVFPKNM